MLQMKPLSLVNLSFCLSLLHVQGSQESKGLQSGSQCDALNVISELNSAFSQGECSFH